MAEDGLNNALGRLKLRGRGRSALRRTGTDAAQARNNPSPSSSSTAVNVAVAPEPTSAPSLREVSGNQLVVRSPRLGRFSQLGPKASDDEKIEQIIDTREVSENTKVVERYREKTVLMWYCLDCDTPCLQIREESRCICGHRLKAHDCKPGGRRKCKERGCRCGDFFYIVAEGSWMLRCQCKHKGIEHDPNTRKCKRPNCKCNGFRSPWVCNCDHPWDRHEQREVKIKVKTYAVEEDDSVFMEVNPWQKLKRGLD